MARRKLDRETWTLKQWEDWLEANSKKVLVVPKLGECWEWTRGLVGSKTHRYANVHYDGRKQSVNRVTFQKQGHRLNPKIHVRHKCDNPKCVNPAHLKLGSHLDNMADRNARGRQAKLRGTDHGRAKLTEAEVLEIRSKYKGRGNGPTQRQLADEYGVTWTLIGKIVNDKLWTHI